LVIAHRVSALGLTNVHVKRGMWAARLSDFIHVHVINPKLIHLNPKPWFGVGGVPTRDRILVVNTSADNERPHCSRRRAPPSATSPSHDVHRDVCPGDGGPRHRARACSPGLARRPQSQRPRGSLHVARRSPPCVVRGGPGQGGARGRQPHSSHHSHRFPGVSRRGTSVRFPRSLLEKMSADEP